MNAVTLLTTPALLRMSDVERLVGLKRSAIYGHIQKGQFPAPLRCFSRTSRWSAEELRQWVANLQRAGERGQ